MLRPRLIPCLLVHNQGLVKTRCFADPRYVGDPINAVRIFNEKAADELMVMDIDASRNGQEPDYRMIANLANECRMPLCYGGGVSQVEQVERIVGLGVEKVAISAAAIENPALIEQAAQRVGSQSVVVVLDVRRSGVFRDYGVMTHNATRKASSAPGQLVREMTNRGAGEILINNIDRDGTMEGYDLDLVGRLRKETTLPMTILGGAGDLQHIRDLWTAQGLIGAAAGSLFVFKGKYRAVLINYPNSEEKAALLRQSGFEP
jgi:cyclase